jgi:hypothetical protein
MTTGIPEVNPRIGEEEAKALYQLDPFGELHITGCPRCSGQCYAKYAALRLYRHGHRLT